MNNYLDKKIDIAIIGAGPVGLAAALEAKRRNLNAVVFEKGIIVNSIFHFPTHMTFFTTADLLEIGNHPFPLVGRKPTRKMALDYYRGVATNENLTILQNHEVQKINGKEKIFTITGKRYSQGVEANFEYQASYIVTATGYFDNPVGLGGIIGEASENVSHYYDQAHKYWKKDVVVIGAGNSGAEASLELYRHGASVTLIHRHPEPRETIKYWVLPDLKNRLKEGSIRGIMPATVKKIEPGGVLVEQEGEEKFVSCDHIFILTGFIPNIKLLEKWGLELREDLSVRLNENYESNKKGVFVIGSAGAGKATNKVFIENGREHAKLAITEISKRIVQ